MIKDPVYPPSKRVKAPPGYFEKFAEGEYLDPTKWTQRPENAPYGWQPKKIRPHKSNSEGYVSHDYRVFPKVPVGMEPDRRVWENIRDPLKRAIKFKRFDIFARTIKNFAFAQDYAPPAHLTKKMAVITKTTPASFGNNPEEISAELIFMLSPPGFIDMLDKSEYLADMIWSLGKIGTKYTKPEEKQFLAQYLGGLLERHQSKLLSSRDVTTVMGGLSKSGVRFHSFEPQIQAAMMRVFGDTAHTFNDREVSNILHSMTRIGLTWAELPMSFRNGIVESMNREHHNMINQQASMCIYSLGLLGLDIDKVAPAVRDRVYTIARSVLDADVKTAVNGETLMMRRYASQQIR